MPILDGWYSFLGILEGTRSVATCGCSVNTTGKRWPIRLDTHACNNFCIHHATPVKLSWPHTVFIHHLLFKSNDHLHKPPAKASHCILESPLNHLLVLLAMAKITNISVALFLVRRCAFMYERDATYAMGQTASLKAVSITANLSAVALILVAADAVVAAVSGDKFAVRKKPSTRTLVPQHGGTPSIHDGNKD